MSSTKPARSSRPPTRSKLRNTSPGVSAELRSAHPSRLTRALAYYRLGAAGLLLLWALAYLLSTVGLRDTLTGTGRMHWGGYLYLSALGFAQWALLLLGVLPLVARALAAGWLDLRAGKWFAPRAGIAAVALVAALVFGSRINARTSPMAETDFDDNAAISNVHTMLAGGFNSSLLYFRSTLRCAFVAQALPVAALQAPARYLGSARMREDLGRRPWYRFADTRPGTHPLAWRGLVVRFTALNYLLPLVLAAPLLLMGAGLPAAFCGAALVMWGHMRVGGVPATYAHQMMLLASVTAVLWSWLPRLSAGRGAGAAPALGAAMELRAGPKPGWGGRLAPLRSLAPLARVVAAAAPAAAAVWALALTQHTAVVYFGAWLVAVGWLAAEASDKRAYFRAAVAPVVGGAVGGLLALVWYQAFLRGVAVEMRDFNAEVRETMETMKFDKTNWPIYWYCVNFFLPTFVFWSLAAGLAGFVLRWRAHPSLWRAAFISWVLLLVAGMAAPLFAPFMFPRFLILAFVPAGALAAFILAAAETKLTPRDQGHGR